MIEIKKKINNEITDEERAFYNSQNIEFNNIIINGPKDGESSFKECNDIIVNTSFFNLRYPFWHNTNATINKCEMTEKCRAAIWYCDSFGVHNSVLNGIKVFRECKDITISNTSIDSKECFWKCNKGFICDTNVISEYPFFECKDLEIERLKLKGKYSFQYCENIKISNSDLKTKDAFWGSKNITVKDCFIEGEYLGWYSENLHLINCTIIGTQPLCYCKGLVLDNCTMINCDLAFEYSDVNAKVNSEITSIKNPLSGSIECKQSEIILDENFKDKGIKINFIE